MTIKKAGSRLAGLVRLQLDQSSTYTPAYANAWGVRCTKAGGPGNMGKSKKKAGGMKSVSTAVDAYD